MTEDDFFTDDEHPDDIRETKRYTARPSRQVPPKGPVISQATVSSTPGRSHGSGPERDAASGDPSPVPGRAGRQDGVGGHGRTAGVAAGKSPLLGKGDSGKKEKRDGGGLKNKHSRKVSPKTIGSPDEKFKALPPGGDVEWENVDLDESGD